MAFKMKRPLKMAGPSKSALKLGRAKNVVTDDGGLYYNSKMGPMKMHSPSALKQMEEDATGMEEMMGMMGGMEGEGPVEEAPVQKEGGEEERANSIAGQEIVVEEDGTMTMTDEYGVSGVPDGAEVKDPNGILEFTEGGEYVEDLDYTFEVEGNTVIITGIEGEVDPDAPGTPGEEGYEPPVEREDLDEEGKAIWDKQREPK